MERYLARMMSDINRYSPDDTISRWNLTRICYVIAVVMLLEFVNLFDADVQTIPYLLIPSCVIILAGLILLPILRRVLKRFDEIPLKTRRRLCLYFWILLPTLTAFPFFIRDAAANRPPLNLLIIIGLISMVPVLNGMETILVFILPALTNLTVYIVVNNNLTYTLYSLVFCLAGVMIATVIHRQYIFLIRELNYRMLHDSLTNLLSRQAGTERADMLLANCLREKRTFAALMIDIDFFKSYNDTKGHLYGDEVLRNVAKAIGDSFLRGNDVVYRYGGEEFCACISANLKSIHEIIDRLTKNISGLGIPAEKRANSQWLTISIGVAVCEKADKTLEEVLRRADELLYASKKEGRNKATVAVL